MIVYTCHAVGNRYTFKTCAIIKCTIANTRYAVGDCYAYKVSAIIKHPTAYPRHTVWNFYAFKISATTKCIAGNCFCTVFYNIRTRNIIFSFYQMIVYVYNSVFPIIIIGVISSTVECIFTYTGNTVWNSYVYKACAIIKCIITYASYAVWNCYTFKTCAIIKCIITYASYAV